MIQIVTPANAQRFRDEMEQVWRLRHAVFVEEKRWTDLARPDGREIDQFDTPHAIHFLALEAGRVIGYSRLLPTTRPHLLSDVLPQLCEGELPRGHDTWEWTRQAVARSHRGRGKAINPVSLALLSGIVEWGLASGVRRLVLQMPTLYLLHVVQLHFRAHPLGLPQAISGEDIIATTAEFDERTLARLRRLTGRSGSVLAPDYPYLAA
ncbi:MULTISPECIES: GNAT family N-acetyltransferase [unclassified Methylobacterium]|uniref:acyl-homoserine-lactone synthase n=1 Tax=unclassified Methylobacterium TaxID=2615210 RepID=UPI0006FF3802|nr:MULTISPECIES: GNAT family N-acetyltransferase [unclassified Methylobacterium]KQP73114.1 autoinducer synthase [Methylobacterium sp. Leaf113]KQP91755.1 autoinducer synthase [Methylobacterium sp. Leaf117]MCK2052655.1 GNAT family N-acetyltransferase [Methylobacterium sp. 37f]